MIRVRSLTIQLSLAMSACVIVTVGMALATALFVMRMERAEALKAGQATTVVDPVSLALLAVPALILGIVLAIVLSRRLSDQLRPIAVAAGRLAAGDLSARARLRGSAADELEQLAASFNTMAGALQSAQQSAIEQSAIIAHELRTPLAVLLGRVQGLKDKVFPCDDESLAILTRQILSLTMLVDDLAVVSLFSNQRLELCKDEIDLAELARQVASDLEERLTSVGMTLTLQLHPARARVDPHRIRQAITALLENAVRHAASGQHACLRTAEESACVTVTVQDEGDALAESELASLFDPFWRGNAARSGAVPGSGLGLSVVRSIAAAHDGSVTARRGEAGVGLQISLKLPKG